MSRARGARAARERRRTANLRVLPVDGPAAPDELRGIADRDQLERGFRRLPPAQRAILVLHHYVGYAPSEIADLRDGRCGVGSGPCRRGCPTTWKLFGSGPACSDDYMIWLADAPNFWWGVTPGNPEHHIVLERAGSGTAFIIVTAPEAEFEAFVTAAEPIVQSFDFTP